MPLELKELEKMMKALANKRRLSILRHLKKHKEVSVGEIAEAINLSVKSTSRHLAVLFSADFVERQQRSLEVYYRHADTFPSIIKHIISIL